MTAQYRPDPAGFRQFMSSAEISKAMTNVADQLASQANSSGRSSYGVRPRTVQGGYRASDRAGAEVYETERHYADVRTRHLRNITKQFYIRGGG